MRKNVFVSLLFLLSVFAGSAVGADPCPMCSAYNGCYYIEADGFATCSNNTCAGTCRFNGFCTDPCAIECGGPCLALKLAAQSCGPGSTKATLTSTRQPTEIFAMSGDNELAQAIVRFESLFGREVSDAGAFSFALAKDERELQQVLTGRALPLLAPTIGGDRGFADYVVDETDGGIEVTLRVWSVSLETAQALTGRTAFLRYETVGPQMTLVSLKALSEMPIPREAYLFSASAKPNPSMSGRPFARGYVR